MVLTPKRHRRKKAYVGSSRRLIFFGGSIDRIETALLHLQAGQDDTAGLYRARGRSHAPFP
jgi:hypothetical protein